MTSKLRTLATASFGVFTLAALLVPTSTPQAEAQHTVNFGTVAPDTNNPWANQLRDTKTRVEKETNGAVSMRLFMNGSLGSEIEMVQDARKGERLQGVGVSAGAMAEGAGIPLVQLTELPYLFNNTVEADAILDGVLWDPVSKALEEKGFIMAIWAENGFRSFGANGPTTTPEELSAFKMRSQETPMHLNMYAALGTQAVTKPTSEVSAALSTGIVDGFDNAPLFTLAGGWFKSITHYTLTEHIYQPAVIAYSKVVWDAMTPDLRATVLGDPAMEAKKGREGVRAENKASLDVMADLGVTIVPMTDDQKDVFRAATIEVHKKYLKDNPSTLSHYKQVQAKLQSMR